MEKEESNLKDLKQDNSEENEISDNQDSSSDNFNKNKNPWRKKLNLLKIKKI